MRNLNICLLVFLFLFVGCTKKEYNSTEEMFADLPRYGLEGGAKTPDGFGGGFLYEFYRDRRLCGYPSIPE